MSRAFKSHNPGWEEGALDLDDPAPIKDALTRLARGRRGPPRDDDVPPPSTFPMTPAARAALEISREHKRPFRSDAS